MGIGRDCRCSMQWDGDLRCPRSPLRTRGGGVGRAGLRGRNTGSPEQAGLANTNSPPRREGGGGGFTEAPLVDDRSNNAATLIPPLNWRSNQCSQYLPLMSRLRRPGLRRCLVGPPAFRPGLASRVPQNIIYRVSGCERALPCPQQQ